MLGKVRVSIVLWGLLFSWPHQASAQPDGSAAQTPAGDAADAVDARVEPLFGQGRYQEALELLKSLPEGEQQTSGVLRAKGRAYEGLGNWVWARRMWTALLEAQPADCDTRARLAWSHLRESDYRETRRVLGVLDETERKPACPGNDFERARWELMLALAAVQEGESQGASRLLQSVEDAPALFPEDIALLVRLRKAARPLRQPPLQAALQAEAGWTTNALQGSPLDPLKSDDDPASARIDLRAWARGRWGHDVWGPSLEAEVRSVGYTADSVQDFSYLGWFVRPGLEWDFGKVWALLAYRLDSVTLANGDKYQSGAYSYFMGHRGEFELDFDMGLTLFGGAGRREFRQLGRSRTEADVGAGWAWPISRQISLLAAGAGRYQQAQDRAYNLVGGTLLTSLSLALGEGWTLRFGATLMADHYPDSEGTLTFGEETGRSEYLVKGKAAVWTPTLADGLQLGVWYEWARRDSTVNAFDYNAHALMLGLTWRLEGDPFVPHGEEVAGHRRLDYGFESSDSALGERLRDLLRKDEDAQRGCSCGN